MVYEYLSLGIFILIAMLIALLLFSMAFIFGPANPGKEKLSSYECGFEPFDELKMKFDIKYCLVAIIFIVFDLEIAFLFPWAVMLKQLGWFGFGSVMFFLLVLTAGFIYEWKKGALEWL